MSANTRKTPCQTVVIVGAGIIGLTCAIKLQEKLKTNGPSNVQLLLVAREWPGSIPGAPAQHSVDYASMWAGAHVRPIPASTAQLGREAKWLKQAAAEFKLQTEQEPSCGVTRTQGVEYLEKPDQGYQKQTAKSFEDESGLSGYRKLSQSELPKDVVLGFEYETYCVNSPVYCEVLLRKFLLRGGKTLRHDLKSEWEAFNLAENVAFVVNASGVGFGDPKCFPTRGQTVVTDLSEVQKTVTRQNSDGTWSFLIPRFFNGGTIVGGTKEPGDWRSTPCPSTRQKLLDGGIRLVPLSTGSTSVVRKRESVEDINVISDVVGRRPTREGGIRLEIEERPLVVHNASERKGKVIHAYGAGGRGYEISWGVANEVAELATPLLNSLSTAKSKL